jgi:hypothetical protein
MAADSGLLYKLGVAQMMAWRNCERAQQCAWARMFILLTSMMPYAPLRSWMLAPAMARARHGYRFP